MNRTTKLKLNTISSIINQIVTVIAGLIIPRFILSYYGSEINGLISSITQFLSVITFLELGIGAVVQSALYKPLIDKDDTQINKIYISAKNFFNKIAFFLVLYSILLMVFYPLQFNQSNYLSISFLVFSMSISLLGQYYFGMVNQLLLNADQKSYIYFMLQIITVILNMIFSVILITRGYSIQIVRLVSSIIYLIRPFILNLYVKNNYAIDTSIEIKEEPLTQKWNGIAQHLASVVLKSTDTIVLTLFSSLENVSIYSVYNMVLNGVKMILTSSTSGLQSFFGNLLASNELKSLNKYFDKVEWIIHNLVVYLFTMTIVLIIPFVEIYTSGIVDANYNVPLFSAVFTISQAIYCLRIPYNLLVLSAGHFKETQLSSIIEAFLNILLSVLLVGELGLLGIAIGTLSAMTYRTIYLVVYLSNNILYRSLKKIRKLLTVDLIISFVMISFSKLITINPENLREWFFISLCLGTVFLIISITINLLFYKENTLSFLKKLKI